MLDEIQQTQKSTPSLMPFIWNSGQGKLLYVVEIRSEVALGWGLTGKGHKGTVWSDDNVLSWVRHMSSPPRLLFKSNRSISCPQAPGLFLLGLTQCPLPGKHLLSQSLQAQSLSVPQELVKIPPSPRSLPRSPST